MIFMSGNFQHIIQLSYKVDPALLSPLLPPFTELDLYNGDSYIGLVGVEPLDLRIYNIPFPWFRHRAQVNLRFYVRRRIGRNNWRHGVVFIRQIVPHRLVAWGARLFLNETVDVCKTDSTVEKTGYETLMVQYSWHTAAEHHFIRTSFRQQPLFAAPATEQDFFIDRHWGYCTQRDASCLEYRFDHPPWKTYIAPVAETVAAVGDYYGPRFAEILRSPPDFSFGCLGSIACLTKGRRIKAS